MVAKRPKPEPLQPGDEQIAREEIDAYYVAQLDQARAELNAAQAAFDRRAAAVSTSLAAFHDGERLADIDAWSIELHAGGVDEFHNAVFAGKPIDRAAYDAAKARSEATARWLRSQGYEPIHDRRR